MEDYTPNSPPSETDADVKKGDEKKKSKSKDSTKIGKVVMGNKPEAPKESPKADKGERPKESLFGSLASSRANETEAETKPLAPETGGDKPPIDSMDHEELAYADQVIVQEHRQNETDDGVVEYLDRAAELGSEPAFVEIVEEYGIDPETIDFDDAPVEADPDAPVEFNEDDIEIPLSSAGGGGANQPPTPPVIGGGAGP